jgi:hypothetical protein
MGPKVYCEKCSEQVVDSPFFELLSTSNDSHDANDLHFVCGACFGLLDASRGCAPFFECPNHCKRVIVGHCYHSTALVATRQGVKNFCTYTRGPGTYIKSPTLKQDPVWFYQNQPTEEKLETMVLNIAFAEKKNDGNLKNEWSFSVQVPFTKRSDEYSYKSKKKLVNFTKLLYHVYVFPLESTALKLSFASIEDLDDHSLTRTSRNCPDSCHSCFPTWTGNAGQFGQRCWKDSRRIHGRA